MTIEKAKIEYDNLLLRFKKANTYFERKDIANQEKEEFLDFFIEILTGLNYYLGKIEIYNNKEVLEGFNLG